MIFTAANECKKLKFSVKISMAYALLVYTLFCPSAEYEGRGLNEGVEGKNRYLSLQVSLLEKIKIKCKIYSISGLALLPMQWLVGRLVCNTLFTDIIIIYSLVYAELLHYLS